MGFRGVSVAAHGNSTQRAAPPPPKANRRRDCVGNLEQIGWCEPQEAVSQQVDDEPPRRS